VPATAPGNDESDSDVPLAASKLAKEKAQIMKEENAESRRLEAEDKKAAAAKKRKATAVKKEEESDDSDAPLAKGKRRAAPAKKANGVKKEESSDDDIPLAKKPRATKAAATKAAAVKKEPAVKKEAKGKGRVKKSETPATTAGEGEEEDEEEYKWWEHQAETDGTVKWTTLEHNGVIFPPPYEPLPKDVKMLYNGVPITLPVEAEEVAGFFGAMLETPHAKNPKFVENFFRDFQEILKESGGAKNPEGKVRSDSNQIFCILTVV
jgi:DNA topoisomerase-1